MSKKILIVTDNINLPTGVANQTRHIVKKLYQKGHIVYTIGVGSAQNPFPPVIHVFDSFEKCVLIDHNKYDDMNLIGNVVAKEGIDCVVLFTDPHRYSQVWLNRLSLNVPLYYVSVWDTYLAPQTEGKYHYNLPIYENCDGIGCISKQTEWLTQEIFKKAKYRKPYIHYVGHGSDSEIFKPLSKEQCADARKRIFGDKTFDFVVFMGNRNQGRKKFPDLIEAWRMFFASLPKEKSEKCALLLHTETVSEAGTNLLEVIQALAPNTNIFLHNQHVSEPNMNELYNVSDVVCNISNAEGFGLTLNEGMLAGKPVIANATGGLVDQIGFFMAGGQVMDWTPENKAKLKSFGHGVWAKPIYPQRTIIGHPATPYLYDELASIDDVCDAIKFWYYESPTERQRVGLRGRDWCLSMGLNSNAFAEKVATGIETTIESYQPRNQFQVYSV